MLQRPLASLLLTSAKIKINKHNKFTVMLGQQRRSRGLLGHGVKVGRWGILAGTWNYQPGVSRRQASITTAAKLASVKTIVSV